MKAFVAFCENVFYTVFCDFASYTTYKGAFLMFNTNVISQVLPAELIRMNENSEIKTFLSQLRKFLPERVIYEAFSALPEDIFDVEDYISVPYLKSDEEIQEFISENGFEDPQNIISFFMEQYMNNLFDIISDVFDDMEDRDESGSFMM